MTSESSRSTHAVSLTCLTVTRVSASTRALIVSRLCISTSHSLDFVTIALCPSGWMHEYDGSGSAASSMSSASALAHCASAARTSRRTARSPRLVHRWYLYLRKKHRNTKQAQYIASMVTVRAGFPRQPLFDACGVSHCVRHRALHEFPGMHGQSS